MSKSLSKEQNEQIMELWKTCVDMANSNSDKRMTANNAFMTIDVGLMAILTFSSDLKNILVAVIGIVISSIWILSISRYKALNKAKFVIIDELESKMEYAPFRKEWRILSQNKRHLLTSVEYCLPIVFIILFVIVGILAIPSVNSLLASWFSVDKKMI